MFYGNKWNFDSPFDQQSVIRFCMKFQDEGDVFFSSLLKNMMNDILIFVWKKMNEKLLKCKHLWKKNKMIMQKAKKKNKKRNTFQMTCCFHWNWPTRIEQIVSGRMRQFRVEIGFRSSFHASLTFEQPSYTNGLTIPRNLHAIFDQNLPKTKKKLCFSLPNDLWIARSNFVFYVMF